MDSRKRLASECHQLRLQLKEWEKSFSERNSGRRPVKEDIKKNTEIAAKYKAYNQKKDILDGKTMSASRHVSPTQIQKQRVGKEVKEPDQRDSDQRPGLLTTPRKGRAWVPEFHPSILDPYDVFPSSASPHTYVFKNAIGPTPQRHGKILGLFDSLSSNASPSAAGKRKADQLDEAQVTDSGMKTPSRKPVRSGCGDLLQYLDGRRTEHRRHSRTPASEGKRFLLSQFFATPTIGRYTAIAEQDTTCAGGDWGLDLTPSKTQPLGGKMATTSKIDGNWESTPSFLKRSKMFRVPPLGSTSRALQSSGAPVDIAFKSPDRSRQKLLSRPFKGRSPDEILRGLRKVEENTDVDGLDALREVECNEVNVLEAGDQITRMAESGVDGVFSTRTWRKKGQKRTTRRVIMRPIASQATLKKTAQEAKGDADGEPTRVDETEDLHDTETGEVMDVGTDDLQYHSPASGNAVNFDKSTQGTSVAKRTLFPSNIEDGGSDPEYGSEPGLDDLLGTTHSDSLSIKHSPHASCKKRKMEVPSNSNKMEKEEEETEKKNGTGKGKETGKGKTANKTKGKMNGQGRETGKAKAKEKKVKGAINPNAQSHMNFRSLKIRNRESNRGGRGGRIGGGRGRR
jgi:hypothetical protein